MPYKDPAKRREYNKFYQRRYRKRLGDEYNKYHREWSREDYKKNGKRIYELRRSKIHERIAASIRNRIREVLTVYNSPRSKRTKELLGCDFKQVKSHLESQFAEGMSWDNYGEWHIDHRLPLARFDLTKGEEQEKAFHYTNLQPLWAKDNMSKGAKVF